MTTLISLLAAGLVLVAAEIFLPGMIAGILGIVCLLAAVVWTWQEFGAQPALIILVIELVGGTILFLLWIKYFPSSRAGRLFSLAPPPPQHTSDGDHSTLLGLSGVALTPLRPSGTAKIDGRRTDVVSEGGAINAGENITVVKVEGSRIVVRPSPSAPKPESSTP